MFRSVRSYGAHRFAIEFVTRGRSILAQAQADPSNIRVSVRLYFFLNQCTNRRNLFFRKYELQVTTKIAPFSARALYILLFNSERKVSEIDTFCLFRNVVGQCQSNFQNGGLYVWRRYVCKFCVLESKKHRNFENDGWYVLWRHLCDF